MPRGPVQALALPALATIARMWLACCSRISWSYSTGAALTRLVVNTPAALHGPSAATSARSSVVAPIALLVLSPQDTAAARKPRARVKESIESVIVSSQVSPSG
jgi:hypothetical protein